MKKRRLLVNLSSFLLAAAPGLIATYHCPFIFIGEPKLPKKAFK